MKNYKKYLSLATIALASLLTASPVLASVTGILPTPYVGVAPTAATVSIGTPFVHAGETATVTFTFPAPPVSFTIGDITAPNGVMSALAVTGDPKIYTATFTPDVGVATTNNTISVASKVTAQRFVATVDYPQDIAFDGTNMWTTNYFGSSVTKITPAGATTVYTGTGDSPNAIAFDGTNMWTANYGDGNVTKITPGGVTTSYAVSGNPEGIAFDGTNMWTANYGDNSVSKITPGGVVTRYAGTGSFPHGIAFDGTNMWTSNLLDASVTKVSPTGVMTTYTGTGSYPNRIAFDGTNMWTANYVGNSVTKITPTGVMTTYSVPDSPYSLAFDGTNMWTGNIAAESVSKVSPTGVVTTYTGINSPHGMAFDGTDMWTASYGWSTVTKLSTSASGVSTSSVVDTTVALAASSSLTHGFPIAPVVLATSLNGGALDFTSTKSGDTLTLSFNADPKTVTGYAASFDPGFKDTGIHLYAAGTKATLSLSGASNKIGRAHV